MQGYEHTHTHTSQSGTGPFIIPGRHSAFTAPPRASLPLSQHSFSSRVLPICSTFIDDARVPGPVSVSVPVPVTVVQAVSVPFLQGSLHSRLSSLFVLKTKFRRN